MSNVNFEKATEQFETLFFGPARAYAALTIDYSEKLISAQFEATQAYTDASLKQARALFDIKDADGLRAYVEDQNKVVKELGERFKGDAEKVVAMNQEFVQKGQKMVEDNVKTASKAATQASK
ncbi:phasin family protein [Litchfieldella rifensis]|uniref:Phasin family protein n=1 Tax=Litchfieldella rifensis TaxID=762643 RepID=A0ABV7LRL4_9GAMM